MLAPLLLITALLATPPGSPDDPGPDGRELAAGAANLDFIIVNRTGRTIEDLNIAPADEQAPGDEERWSDDILVQREVPDGERAAASYTRDVELCLWDIRVTFQGGDRRSWPAVNLCDTIRVELR